MLAIYMFRTVRSAVLQSTVVQSSANQISKEEKAGRKTQLVFNYHFCISYI